MGLVGLANIALASFRIWSGLDGLALVCLGFGWLGFGLFWAWLGLGCLGFGLFRAWVWRCGLQDLPFERGRVLWLFLWSHYCYSPSIGFGVRRLVTLLIFRPPL